MKSLNTASILFGLAGVLLSTAALSAPGRGWDFYNNGAGDPIPVGAQSANAPGAATAGKGWDFMQNGGGQAIAVSAQASGSASAVGAGKGWDFYNMGLGERIPVDGHRL